MTFTEIVSAVADRLNLTSTSATTRIGVNLNDRYRRVTSSLGINTSRRSSVTANTTNGSVHVTFALQKLENVYCTVSGKQRVLGERTYAEFRQATVLAPRSGDPEWYAIEITDGSGVTVSLFPTPDSVLALGADGLATASTLSGSNVPAFPADFHDILIKGCMADEYAKMDNVKQASYWEGQYEARLAELRYFLAKSIYLSNHQGKRTRNNDLMSPPYSWIV